VVGKERGTPLHAGTAWYAGPYYQSFWGYWDYGWSSVYSPGYVYSNTVVTIETVMFSVEKNSLMWAAPADHQSDEDIRKAVKDLANAAGKRMRKDGLLKKQ